MKAKQIKIQTNYENTSKYDNKPSLIHNYQYAFLFNSLFTEIFLKHDCVVFQTEQELKMSTNDIS